MRFLMIMCVLFVSNAVAVDISRVNNTELKGSTIAYYFGSFDPFHNGHMEVVELLKERVDYVLLVPAGGPDKRKPHRTASHLRRDILGHLFQEDPAVITSHMNPKELQDYLLPHMSSMTFLGVQGTDILDEFENASPEALEIYLQGKPIPAEKADTALGSMMLVKAETLFVPVRDPSSKWSRQDKFHQFSLIPIPLSEECGIFSSSLVKEKIRTGKPFEHLVPPFIALQIKEKSLYSPGDGKK